MTEEINELKTIKLASWAEEKIGLANYSNVTIGGSITREIPEGDDEFVAQKLRENFELIEGIVAEERQKVLESVQESKK